MSIGEGRDVTVYGRGTEMMKVGTLYAKRDDPFDIRFGYDHMPAPNEYDRLGEVYAKLGGMLMECGGAFRLVGGPGYAARGYDALAVATGAAAPARLVATSEAEAHALAKVAEAHEEMRRREREI